MCMCTFVSAGILIKVACNKMRFIMFHQGWFFDWAQFEGFWATRVESASWRHVDGGWNLAFEFYGFPFSFRVRNWNHGK